MGSSAELIDLSWIGGPASSVDQYGRLVLVDGRWRLVMCPVVYEGAQRDVLGQAESIIVDNEADLIGALGSSGENPVNATLQKVCQAMMASGVPRLAEVARSVLARSEQA